MPENENAYEGEEGAAVAVIGLGQMGARLAEAFLAAGFATTVWNRTAAKADALVARGAVRAGTPTEAAEAAALVVVCLPDYDTVRELLAPVERSLRGRVLVNLTSGTPDSARTMSERVTALGADYLDGAAMSGTRLVGRPEALFVFSGSGEAFRTHRPVLASLGNPVHLGGEPGLAAVYDTALFGLAWGALAGFYHAVALAGAEGVDPAAFAEVAAGHMPFVTSLMTDHARQIGDGEYPDADGTVAVHAAAMAHLADTSRALGVHTDVPDLARLLLERANLAGHGADGIASVVETLSKRRGAARP
ncbi:NAD(P)-binding domain-containing protein [Streptomyces sp. N2-109]|uniref:NAD(P)-binding domain-containing protein n=1 Tax=Streptomyces gossypii TaxID=2883101 RepID=A0ABT2K3H4_9ACTN|nr:NAD(P)-binding domain-containing protein [Streptomyces gossypii]MCT2594711.1 NAD(P)-binding domain-containing protein [Streptomyces gossypii]